MAKLQGVKTIDMQDGDITKVSYQGEVYTKVAHDFKDAQSGDIFLNSDTDGYFEITIREKDFFGVPHPVRFTTDGGNDNGYMRECSIHPVYRKSPAAVSPPFAEMITSKVSAVEKRVSALEVAKEPTPIFIEGDGVKALRDGEFSDIEAGEYGEITRFLVSSEYTVRVVDGEGYIDYFRPQDLELATEKPAKPVVGDIVVITRNTAGSVNSVGDIGKVTKGIYSQAKVQVPGGPENAIWTSYSEMRLATITEVERYYVSVVAERKKAELAAEREAKDAVFTKAGRKPNEYRKGDVVRVTGGYGGIKRGDIGVISRAETSGCPQISARGQKRYCHVEIVCFAEDRKDAVTKGGR